ncbi:sigma-70 family RNA polymerase sigma factor [Clostridium sp. PL3]|uniref:Sigma-70 family RNA polymerase sigma factor n=1 Tax=Clostridium thailandense TaxID=2794346 RepID=A0A949TMP8_9CLOT|nr:sigma-70 family RNA polymerase sigma factor [Clostridium thailandense]MBV7275709.1 sigma-70 family RNA polymerase sigma factor [Clostridium thailandense]
MKIEKLQRLINGVKNKESDCIIELNNIFKDYAKSIYTSYIGKTYGNQYEFDYISEVNTKLINGTYTFDGKTDKEFYAYMNAIIRNCASKLLKSYIQPFYRVASLNEFSENISVSTSIEEYVISKISNEELIYDHLFTDLSKEEKNTVTCNLKEEESIYEYAERKEYKTVTVRSYMSKAVSKMRKYAKAHHLSEKYLIHY